MGLWEEKYAMGKNGGRTATPLHRIIRAMVHRRTLQRHSLWY